MKNWKSGLLSGFMLFASGCSMPDAFRAGYVERRIEWVNGNYHGKMGVPLARLEGIWKEDKVESYVRMDYTKAIDNDLVGSGELFGAGVRYYPFEFRGLEFGVEVGADVYHADAVSVWEYGPIKWETQFDGYGYGINLGIDTRFKINDRVSLFAGAGQYFSSNNFEPIKIDAGEWYATGGIEINLTGK
jgi:hypothetical protein